MDGWMDGWMDTWIGGWIVDRWLDRERKIERCKYKRMDLSKLTMLQNTIRKIS